MPDSAARPADLVDIHDVDPSIRLDLRYATPDNIAGRAVYPVARCLMHLSVARRLSAVQDDLRERGLGLVVFDAYRPFSVQRIFWDLYPDENFIARPVMEAGRMVDGSHHNRGAAVDVALVDLASGALLEMPSAFDEFGPSAWRTYAGMGAAARRNMLALEAAMVGRGFEPLVSEWWHYSAPDWADFALLDLPLDA